MSRFSSVKQFLLGKPIATKHAHNERISKRVGLAVFSSDALSSVAYATEEVLLILVLAGTLAYNDLLWIAVVLAVLLVIVAVSYHQTIHAYPEGGGSYSVSKSNLGSFWGRIAGAALLLDYILTVSVSVASGVGALVSAVPATHPYMTGIGVAVVLVLMVMNLRGTKESGTVFAVPTYLFILSMFSLIFAWIFYTRVHAPTLPIVTAPAGGFHLVTAFLLLRAFAASCTAMTGVEAISNGVQAFRKPEADNASKTLVAMAVTLLLMFVGISWAAQYLGIVPMNQADPHYKTVLAQIAIKIYGGEGFPFYFTQGTTIAILFLAANTAFADFPRLGSLLARDGYLPRALTSLGDKLVFNNGILILSVLSIALIIGFQSDTHLLIPLYAVGVFTAFTLSQLGMVVRWWKMKKRGLGMIVNLLGFFATGVVTIILGYTKFFDGAYITIFAIAAVMLLFEGIHRHYTYLAKELEIEPTDKLPIAKTIVVLLVPRMHKGILQAIAYARSLSNDVRAIHVTLDPKSVGKVKEDWTIFGAEMPLVILESPYRSLVEPLLEYIDEACSEDKTLMVTVIVPQAIPKHWWQAALHNNIAHALKRALGLRKNVVVTNVRYFLK